MLSKLYKVIRFYVHLINYEFLVVDDISRIYEDKHIAE